MTGAFLIGAIPRPVARLGWVTVINVSCTELTYFTVNSQYKLMSQYLPISLTQLLQKVESGDLALPHIQRAFVWEPERVSKFMDSLMKDYPIQPFMFWKTKAKVKVRRFQGIIDDDVELSSLYDDTRSSRDDVIKELVLDGQQRIQSLYAVFAGGFKLDSTAQIAWFNAAHDGVVDGQDRFCFSVNCPGSDDEVGVAPAVCWLEVRKLTAIPDTEVEDYIDAFWESISSYYRENSKVAHAIPDEKLVKRNLRRLDDLLRKKQYNYILLDGTVSKLFTLKTIIEIFVRVNSGAVKLEPSELMFATLKGGWPEAEEELDEVRALLNEKGTVKLSFDMDVVLRCLSLAYDNTCIVNEDNFQDLAAMQSWAANWAKAEESFNVLNDLIAQELQLYGEKMVPGYSAFLPIFSYVYERLKRDSTGLTLDEKRDIFVFYYTAQLLGWFSSQTDSKVNKLNSTIRAAKGRAFPLVEIRKVFSEEIKRPVDVLMKDLNTKSRRSIVLNLAYVVANSSSPFKVASKSNKPDADHIYPKKLLRTIFASEAPEMPEKAILDEINHIGNFRLIGATENRKRKDTPPDLYFGKMKEGGHDIIRHLLVEPYCSDPAALAPNLSTYRAFRDARAAKMLEMINSSISPRTPA